MEKKILVALVIASVAIVIAVTFILLEMKRSKFELKEWKVVVSDSTVCLQIKYSISTEYIIYAGLR